MRVKIYEFVKRSPLAFPIIAAGAVILFFLLMFTISSSTLRWTVPTYHEIPPTVNEWTAGPLRIIDIRTGTEINRIVLGPGDRMIAERIYVNWEGEQEVRRIGTSNN